MSDGKKGYRGGKKGIAGWMGSAGGRSGVAVLYTGVRKGLTWKVTSEQGLK